MNANSPEPDESQPLTFYCRDCHVVFVAAPDGTGYEQAVCPKCNEVCMTIEFEQQEQERHRQESTLFSILGSVTGLFRASVPGHQPRRDTSQLVTIARYEDRADAERDAEVLVREGIEATLELNSIENPNWFGETDVPCIELQARSGDVQRARDILDKTDGVLPRTKKGLRLVEDVTFACEECGDTISFPGNRRGGVETCPRCHKYVDVPDN